MVDIGFTELLTVGVVALLVLGPDRLPVAARTCGLWLGKIKRTLGTIQSEVKEELRVEELKQATARKYSELEQEYEPIKRSFGSSTPRAETTNTASGNATNTTTDTAADTRRAVSETQETP